MDELELTRVDAQLQSQEEPFIEAHAIDLRARGDGRPAEELAEGLRRFFPKVDKRFIEAIEESPGYAQRVLNKQMGKIAASMNAIVDKLIEKSEEGNLQAIDRLMRLAGVGSEGPKVLNQKNTQNNINLGSASDTDILRGFREASRKLGAERNNPTE